MPFNVFMFFLKSMLYSNLLSPSCKCFILQIYVQKIRINSVGLKIKVNRPNMKLDGENINCVHETSNADLVDKEKDETSNADLVDKEKDETSNADLLRNILKKDETSNADLVDKEKDETSNADLVDKEKDETSNADLVDKEKDETSNADLVDKEKEHAIQQFVVSVLQVLYIAN
ncbi:myb-like protein X isoform X4 [Acyrthosiphon pisum]|uniref:Uncharacterized protein n=1 Tax=Acyrthosiphon pisum TaxID=7029 RepID=A0A8R2JUK1_ACYPI|nr:myb-like protein X isoform X3 [Acyrthosiphon pisum]XP_029347753.1 myb-like protein X isoform X4 [Acyrthosiphon pisum]